MAKLIVVSPDGQREFELGAVTTLGRHTVNTIRIFDRIVSKEHARITRRPDGKFLYEDLGSLNGSFYAGARLKERVLADGDEILVGATQLRFQGATTSEAVLEQVTIGGAANEAVIKQKVQAAAAGREFEPEAEIDDIAVLRRDYERLRLAHELNRSIELEVNIDVLLEKIIMKAFELIPCDRGVILLMEDGVPRPRIARTRDGRNEQIVLSRSIINDVVQHESAVLSSDASVDSRFLGAHSIILSGIRSTMTVPLMHHDSLLGIMHLDSLLAVNAFGEKDLEIFAGIANQAASAIANSYMARKIEEEARTRAQFQRLLSPNLVEQVVAGKLQLEKGGTLSEVTLLFSDIRGFTAMSESREPQEIVRMLNEYFELMVDSIFVHRGTLDKFVGDEIIALFGAPVAIADAEFQAVQCALDMLDILDDFNRTRGAEGLDEIKIGIGINTGNVVTGAIGSSRALQYTAVGDAMNVAARLCSAAEPGEILISQPTHSRVRDRVAAKVLPPLRLKGKAVEQTVYRVMGLRTPK